MENDEYYNKYLKYKKKYLELKGGWFFGNNARKLKINQQNTLSPKVIKPPTNRIITQIIEKPKKVNIRKQPIKKTEEVCTDFNKSISNIRLILCKIFSKDKLNFVHNILNLDKPIQKSIDNNTGVKLSDNDQETINEIYNLVNIDSFKNRLSLLIILINEIKTKIEDKKNNAYYTLLKLFISYIKQQNGNLKEKPFTDEFLSTISKNAQIIYDNVNTCNTNSLFNSIQEIIKQNKKCDVNITIDSTPTLLTELNENLSTYKTHLDVLSTFDNIFFFNILNLDKYISEIIDGGKMNKVKLLIKKSYDFNNTNKNKPNIKLELLKNRLELLQKIINNSYDEKIPADKFLIPYFQNYINFIIKNDIQKKKILDTLQSMINIIKECIHVKHDLNNDYVSTK
jgi:hypothetical protein